METHVNFCVNNTIHHPMYETKESIRWAYVLSDLKKQLKLYLGCTGEL